MQYKIPEFPGLNIIQTQKYIKEDVRDMENIYFDAVISQMQVLLDGQHFVADGEIYKNDTKAMKIEYREDVKQFALLLASVNDGNIGEFSTVSTWLFDETQNEKDAQAVGVDFADTLRRQLGLKGFATGKNSVALPTVSKNDAITVTALTQKLLAVYPQFKEDYKADVAQHGRFLYLDFIAHKFAPAIREMLKDQKQNKKQIKKLFDMLIDMYVQGDASTSDAVVTLISAATFGDGEIESVAKEAMKECPHLSVSVRELSARIPKSKKLRAALGL